MLQADLMDEEIEAAEHLAKYKFIRAAGAVAGVVLERHLTQVCINHEYRVAKKNPILMILMNFLNRTTLSMYPNGALFSS